jgi:UDP-N-acetylmuramoyl-L-alanyl-D-glutamate--2,6-diaminopimelate ligase
MNLEQLINPLLSNSELIIPRVEISGLVTDNRDVELNDCFIALAGITHHGKQFIDDALERGASAVIVESDTDSVEMKQNTQQENIPVIYLARLKLMLNTLLIDFYNQSTDAFDMRLLAVTGTNGKSSITRFIAQMSAALNQPAGLMGTLGFGIWPDICESKNTTPELAVLLRQFSMMKQQGAEVVAMEVSSHGIEQQRIEGLTFDTAVFANLSQDHLDYHGDMESYFAIKRQLFLAPELKFAIINSDDDYGQRLLLDEAISAKKLSYGFADTADIKVVNWQMHGASIDADISTPWGNAHFSIDMVGDFNLANVLAAIAVLAVEEQFSLNEIVDAIENISPAPGRMQAYQKNDSAAAIVDFAHTPDALKNVLATLSRQMKKQSSCGQSRQGKLALVFGCGGNRDKEKRALMSTVAQELADVIYLTADNPRHEELDTIITDMQLGLDGASHKKVRIELDREQAINKAVNELNADDVLLIAGKGHETYQDVAGVKIPYSDEAVLLALGYQDSSSKVVNNNSQEVLK